MPRRNAFVENFPLNPTSSTRFFSGVFGAKKASHFPIFPIIFKVMGFWINEIPTLRLREEPKRRVYWITRDEAARLINALPDHIVRQSSLCQPGFGWRM